MKRLVQAVIGLAAGLGVGLFYAWVLNPVKFTDTAPASLREDFRAEYTRMVARSFAVDGDVERARARLAALGEANPAQAVTALAQRAAASGGDEPTVRALASLASALGGGPGAAGQASATPLPTQPAATTEPTSTPAPSDTPVRLPTRTPSPTSIGVFSFVGKQQVCSPKPAQPLLQVIVMDSRGESVPGVEVIVEWEGGFDHFYTGLKPEVGAGYGDFSMAPGVSYTARLADSPAAAVSGVAVEDCPDSAGKPFPGSWLLVFRQP